MPQENEHGKNRHGTCAQSTLALPKPLGKSTDPVLEFPECYSFTVKDKSSA